MHTFEALGRGTAFKRKSGKSAGKFEARRTFIIDGERVTKSFLRDTKKGALAALAAFEEQCALQVERAAAGPEPDRALGAMTVAEWTYCHLTQFKSVVLRESTLEVYLAFFKSHILQRLDDIALRDFDVFAAQAFFNDLTASGLAPATIRKYRDIIGPAMAMATERGIIERDPMPAVVLPKKRRKQVRVLSHAEQAALVQELDEASPFARIFLLMLGTGLRIGEVLALEPGDVDLQRGAIHVRHSLAWLQDHGPVVTATKNGESRTVPISPTVHRILVIQLDDRRLLLQNAKKPPEWGLLFLTSRCTPFRQSNVLRHLRLVLERAGLPRDITNHTFRHTFATRCVEAGLHPAILKNILGHEDFATTEAFYIGTMEDHTIEQAERLETVF